MINGLRDFLILVVVTLPFFGQALPYGVPVFLPVLFLMVLLTLTIVGLTEGIGRSVLVDGPFHWLLVAVMISYVYGLSVSVGPEPIYVVREVLNGAAAIAVVYAVTNSGWTPGHREKFVTWIFSVLVAIGAVIAVLGLYKFYRLTQGDTLSWVSQPGRVYPWGTSLVADYNFYALSLLVAVMSAIALGIKARQPAQLVLASISALCIVAGILAGSRRFWIAAPVLVIAQWLWAYRWSGCDRKIVSQYLTSVIAVLLVGSGVFLYRMSDSMAQILSIGWTFQERLMSLTEVSAGLGARFPRWSLAIEKLDGTTPWVGQGFEYLRGFGCEFLDCVGIGYPHMPLLSSYLFGGISALVCAIGLFIIIIWRSVRLLTLKGIEAGIVFPMFATFIFATISANGPLSIRSFVILAALCVALTGMTESQRASVHTV